VYELNHEGVSTRTSISSNTLEAIGSSTYWIYALVYTQLITQTNTYAYSKCCRYNWV